MQSWGDARLFLRQHHTFKWIIGPGLIYTVLFIVAMYLFWSSSSEVVAWMNRQLNIETWLQRERNQFLSFLFVMNGMMLQIVLVLVYFAFFRTLILIIGAPLFAFLSEKTEAIIDGREREYRFTWKDLEKDSLRATRLALRNLGWHFVYLFGLILLSLVPLVGWVTPVIALLMECYYFGFAMLDYSFARNGYSISQSADFTGRHKGLAIGNGFLFYTMHALIILAPAYAIIAATLSFQKVKSS